MDTKVEQAVSLFKQGYNCSQACSQAILAAYAEHPDLRRKTALKLACGFGGGMRMAETCGAVTGAFMVIGLKYGPADAEDKNAKEKTYELVREFAEKFNSRNGSVICKELLGCDISTREGAKIAKENNLCSSLCPKMIRDAAEIIEEMTDA
ncbi:MAG: C-GCAxxG-C-C family protein [Planctomycetota bacterium]|jgi:C_GCAxxG_C_C family probable redox protein